MNTPKISPLPVTKSYFEINRGVGIQGMTLNLSLAQCQKLRSFFDRSRTILNQQDVDTTIMDAKDLLCDLMPLLENFTIFENPEDKNLF